MKILLTAINAKYIHSNLAVYSLKKYAETYKNYKDEIEITEYTINHSIEYLLQELYKRKPDVLFFSCYIWNFEIIKELITEFDKIRPDIPIWVGGPEVSYDADIFLKEYPMLTGVIRGEGEGIFAEIASYYIDSKVQLDHINGITYYDEKREIINNDSSYPLELDTIPFVYDNLTEFENRILYYETSRGCPFSCSYCLSSIDKKVRFRSFNKVKEELQFFLDQKVKQVKFVDRTFNCSHVHAMNIWKYIHFHDNGVTNFHFEISADLLTDEEIAFLSELRPGLIQLEIGVQSANHETIREINRKMDLERLKKVVKRLNDGKNIHLHLDLIAGLPDEDYSSFRESFNYVYGMAPDQLQLGFLKVLKGSEMNLKALEYGILYREKAPYEVLSTRWISYGELLLLKGVEEMTEVYYNSGQFSNTMMFLSKEFTDPFTCYYELSLFYEKHNLAGLKHARISRYNILLDFIKERLPDKQEKYKELLLFDLYLRENMKNRPDWAESLDDYKEHIREFYNQEGIKHSVLPSYQRYSGRQLSNMTHIEVFQHLTISQRNYKIETEYKHRSVDINFDVIDEDFANMRTKEQYVLFHYGCRNALTYEAETIFIS